MLDWLFATPPPEPVYDRSLMDRGFFIRAGDVPTYIEQGTYHPGLFALAFIVVAVASYVALSIISAVVGQSSQHGHSYRIKLACGAFAMGAGIWAMHYIGLLAYDMELLVEYCPWVTITSIIVAIVFSGAAFMIISRGLPKWKAVIAAAALLGVGITTMHFIGMQAMQMDAALYYKPIPFFLAFTVAVGGTAIALCMIFRGHHSAHPRLFRAAATLCLVVAVGGMHWLGVTSKTVLPYADAYYATGQDYSGLAIAIGLITALIIAVAFLAKKLDEALVEMEARTAQLLQAQKMEAIGQLTGGIAHDFNNILAVLMGNLELLERNIPSNPKTRTYLLTAMESVERAKDLTQRLLAFSRKQVLQPEPTNLNQLVKSMLHYMGRTLGVEIEIKTALTPRLPQVRVDQSQLETALLNLAINARDAMPGGGSLEIRTGIVHLKRADIDNMDLTPGNYVTISVSDSGTGMPPHVVTQAMEPFFTTKEIGRGSGMGLSMVFGFARQSGGDVWLESALNIGTTVTIYLPVASDLPLTEDGQPAPEEVSQKPLAADKNKKPLEKGNGANILVVDDETHIREVLQIAFADLGYRVHLAANGPEGLSVMEQQPNIKVLVTDISMPGGMNGYKLAEEALQLNPGMGIVFISGYAKEKMPSETLLHARYKYLPKPYSLEELIAAVGEVL